MPDKKICKLAFVFLYKYSKIQGFLTDISLLTVSLFEKDNRYSVIPYCISQPKIKTVLNKSLINLAGKIVILIFRDCLTII